MAEEHKSISYQQLTMAQEANIRFPTPLPLLIAFRCKGLRKMGGIA